MPDGVDQGLFTDEWMQSVAQEMNLSETAFLVKVEGGYGLRWFTPTKEVSLCGHATLASAHILWERGYADSTKAIGFHTKSGLLTAKRNDKLIELDFPSDPVRVADAPMEIVQLLGAEPVYVGKGREDYLIEIKNEDQLRQLSPDIAGLRKIPVDPDGFTPRGFIVTARARAESEGYDFVSRFFAPAAGIDEDPVTGSAHCTLAAFWAERLGRSEMTGYQASRRGGFVNVRLAGDRVTLGGQAVTVYAAHLKG